MHRLQPVRRCLQPDHVQGRPACRPDPVGHAGQSAGQGQRQARRALAEFRIAGIPTNREFLLNLLSHPEFLGGHWHTALIESNLAALCAPNRHPRFYSEPAASASAMAKIDPIDPLAILAHGKRDSGATPASTGTPIPLGVRAIGASILGSVVSIDVAAGDRVQRGQQIAFNKRDAVSDAERCGILTGDGERRRADVDRGDLRSRQMLRRADSENAAPRADVGDLQRCAFAGCEVRSTEC